MNAVLTSSTNVWRASLMLALVTLLGFGLLYSLAATGIGGLLFPAQAKGSLIERDGRVIGSSLVAQPFADDRYFQSRPSAAGYDVMALAGSNQARTNPDLRARIDEARTQSGGGIDPHLSPEAIRIQIARVARARGVDAAVIERLVAEHSEGKQFGLFGEPRVNVLELNLALDGKSGVPSPRVRGEGAEGG
ncbi:MAG: potassium-transporting ATPase subunit C [Stenotrophomonas acidaminiphila]|nr:MAG: potassium-transporting ATPase subunit C [Stenotrophomonas acidaminiphila]